MNKKTKTILMLAGGVALAYFLFFQKTPIVKIAGTPASSGEDKSEAANFDGKNLLANVNPNVTSRTGW